MMGYNFWCDLKGIEGVLRERGVPFVKGLNRIFADNWFKGYDFYMFALIEGPHTTSNI